METWYVTSSVVLELGIVSSVVGAPKPVGRRVGTEV